MNFVFYLFSKDIHFDRSLTLASLRIDNSGWPPYELSGDIYGSQ